MELSPLARAFINRFQGGFPLHEDQPFGAMAEQLGCSENELLTLIHKLSEEGALSRFGPIYNASLLGGAQTLAAIQVPEERFSEVAGIINDIPEVAHNYRRENQLNMWFVVATTDPSGVGPVLQQIEQACGLKVYDFPKQHEFYLGLWLMVDELGAVDTAPVPDYVNHHSKPHAPDATDRRIIAATQSGLPLVADPLTALAEQLQLQRGDLSERLQQMQRTGAIRRIGAIPNHYRLGLRANGMSVWDVPDELAIELGQQVGALDFVSHSYLRPRHAGVWRYNLFAMVHGSAREEVQTKAAQIANLLTPHCRAHDVLFSSQVLKKTGLRLAA